MATAAGRNFVARCRISLLAKPMVSPLQQDMLRARTSALGGSLLRSRCFSSYYGAVAAATEPLRLNNLSPNPRSTKDRKRVGRGNGSGTGKTCGKGHKGSKARKGGKGPRFEGGQTPMHRRIPKRGFKNGYVREGGVGVEQLSSCCVEVFIYWYWCCDLDAKCMSRLVNGG